MRLKRLHLLGFKSFADRTDIELDSPLVALVGPNGCGKSNVVDAVRWVLGEQSARQLRGREMADVIFGGTDARKPTGYAEASLTLTNEDRSLPVEYDEVVITRRLYRSGESEYILNKQPCRLRDVRQLLLGTGLGMNAYSIIEQGKVDLLLTANAKERRGVFEEAAGIRRFKVQRHECELKLDRTEQNLLRVGDIIEEVEKQLRSVKYQAAKARRFKDYTARLKVLRARLSLGDYRRLAEAQADLETRLTQVAAAVEGAETARRGLAERAAQVEADLARIDQDLNGTERAEVELAGRLTNEEAAVQHHRDSAQRLEVQARRHDEQAAEARANLEVARRRRQDLATGLTELVAEVARREAALETASADLEAAAAALDEQARALEDLKARAVDVMRRLSRVQNELASVAGLKRTLGAQRERQAARRDELHNRAEACRLDAGRLQGRHRDLTERLAAAERDLAALAAERREWLDRQTGARRRLAEARQEHSALASTENLLAGMEARLEGVAEAVKALLARFRDAPGVHGLLADLVQVPRPFVAAIEAALGEAADYLVVDAAQTALALMANPGPEDQRAQGRVGFICRDRAVSARALQAEESASADADSIPCASEDAHSSMPIATTSLPGYVGRASDLIKAAPIAQAAVAALLGDTVVVADLETALAVTARQAGRLNGDAQGEAHDPGRLAAALARRAVTVAGDLCGEGRLVAAGRCQKPAGDVAPSPSGARAPQPGGRIWRRSELAHLAVRIAEVEAEIARREADCAETDERLLTLEAAHAERAAECDRCSVDLVRTAGELDRLGQQAAALDDEVDLLTRELRATDEDLAAAEATEGELTVQRGRLEEEQRGVAAETAGAESRLAVRRQEVAQRREGLTQMRVELAEIRARRSDTEANLTTAEQDVLSWDGTREAAERGAQSARSEAETARGAAEAALLRVDDLRRQQEEVAGRRAALAEARQRIALERSQVAAERDRAALHREELAQERQALEVKAGEVRVKREDLVQRTQEELGTDLVALYEEARRRREAARQAAESASSDTGDTLSLSGRGLGEGGAVSEGSGLAAAAPAPCASEDAHSSAISPANGSAQHPSPLALGEGQGEGHLGAEASTAPPAPTALGGCVGPEDALDANAPPADDDGPEALERLRAEIADLREKLDRLGGVNLEALDELDELEMRATFLTNQRDDLLKAKAHLQEVIRKINRQCREMFTATFEQVREHFQELFRKLFGGGKADMFLEEGEQADVLESGIEIVARPPGKEPRVLSLLSGGEKVMTAVALLLAIFRSNPSPFCLLDEVDAALDESAIGRFVEVLKGFIDRSQFIIVTHNKRTMAAADVLYGVTMPEPGVSRLVTVRLQEVEQRLAQARVA